MRGFVVEAWFVVFGYAVVPPYDRSCTRHGGPANTTQEAPMIRGVHTMFYSSAPEALRAFLRDKLGFSFTDVGGGWLIFDLPEADMGCHPADTDEGARSGT